MHRSRRNLLGIALLGAGGPLLAAPRRRVVAARLEGGGFPPVGHLGDAYGLMAIFVADLERKHGMIVLAGGTSTDPFAPANKGRYSSLARFQERGLTALYRGAILGQAPNRGA
jgi:hypothetical protein